MDKYYNEIEHIIKRNEINKRTREIEDNNDTLNNYWNIGRIIVEAQGGEKRSKYGDAFIKEWSKDYTNKYGKNYGERNLRRMRQFYNTFPIWSALRPELNCTKIKTILPIKDESKRNYYINLCLEHHLSSRELIKEIKSNSYERLIDKPNKIELILPKQEFKITSNTKDPIIFYLKEDEKIKNEHDLEMIFISHLQATFRQ